MSQVNYILKGRYWNTYIHSKGGKLYVNHTPLDKTMISSYEVLDETNKNKYSFLKGAIGAAVFGGIGVVAGIGGKHQKEYMIVVHWSKYPAMEMESLICLDDKFYKVFVQSMF